VSPAAELRVIKNLTKHKPWLSAKEIDKELTKRNKVVLKRRSDSLDLQLEQELRNSEISKCLILLKDMV